jgi:uncharacterized protein involved in exopolysaccharide biosynthesis
MDLEVNHQDAPASRMQDAGVYQLQFLDVLIILLKRRKFIFLFTASVAILSALVVLLIPNRYTARTVVLPPAQSSPGSAILSQLGGSGGLAAAAGASLGIKNPGDMYVALFRSRSVEDTVVQRFDLMNRYHTKFLSDACHVLEQTTKVTFAPKEGLLTVTVTDKDPKMSSDIANGYVEAYRKLSDSLAVTEASQRRLFFQQQLLKAKENVLVAEDALKATEQSTGILQIDSQTRALIQESEALRAQVEMKEVQIQGMRSWATEDNPEMLRAKQQLAALQEQFARVAGFDSTSGMVVPKGGLSNTSLDYIRKVRDVKYYETILELIEKQFEMAKLDEARQGAVIQVVDFAVPPERKSSPMRSITVIVMVLIGFFVACGWCFLQEIFKYLKRNPNDSERYAELRTILRH